MHSDSMTEFDTVIIGSSPLAITEAVLLRSHQRSVLNIDLRPEIGGAWTTVHHTHIPEVEIGCHIWDIEPETVNFLRDFWELELTALSPQPILLKKGWKIPYDWKVNLTTSKLIAKRLLSFKFNLLKHELASPHHRFSLRASRYLYPKRGAKELKNQLLQKAEQHALQFHLNRTIESIKLNEDFVQLTSSDGQTTTANEVVLTSLSSIQSIDFGGGNTIQPKTEQMDYIHMHFIIEGELLRSFSYIRWMDDPIIHRVSDMTFQVSDELEKGHHLICVGILHQAYEKEKEAEFADYILKQLKKERFLSPTAQTVHYATNVFPSFYNDRNVMVAIEQQSKGRIRILRSTNFTYGFYNQLDRYRSLLSTSSDVNITP